MSFTVHSVPSAFVSERLRRTSSALRCDAEGWGCAAGDVRLRTSGMEESFGVRVECLQSCFAANRVSDDGVEVLAESLRVNTGLKRLELWSMLLVFIACSPRDCLIVLLPLSCV